MRTICRGLLEETERDEAVVPSGEELTPGPASELGVPRPTPGPSPLPPSCSAARGRQLTSLRRGRGA